MTMTLFDIIALLILGVSAVVGLARGGIREVANVASFILAIFIATYALRYTGPIAVKAVRPVWAANAVAILIVFVAAYVLLRVTAGALTKSAHKTKGLGALDRLIGGGFGLLRGLVLLGVIGILLSVAMPYDRTPGWITNAKLYPLSLASATALRALAPKGAMVAASIKPAVDTAISEEGAAAGAGSPPATSSGVGQSEDSGYSAAARKGLDDVVERSH
jgi:membrane protein required for colicin V production